MRRNLPQIYEMSGFLTTNSNITDKREGEQTSYMNSCKGVFTMGHWLRDWLISQGLSADKVHVVGGGTNVDVNLIKPLQRTCNKILFIGKDFKRKGGFITYDAFKILRDQGKNTELYVIGPAKNPIDNPIEGYHFIGQIPFEEEAKYYNMCDVFCMPSYFEAYGLVFVEALTFGLPCIGRNCYEMPYFIEDGKTGLLLQHDDPRELATLLTRILNDESFSRTVAANREKYLKDYSWDSVAARFFKVIG